MNKECKKNLNYMLALSILSTIILFFGIVGLSIFSFCMIYLGSAAYILILSCFFLFWLIPQEFINDIQQKMELVQLVMPAAIVVLVINFIMSFFITFCINRIKYEVRYRNFYRFFPLWNFLPFTSLILTIFAWIDFSKMKKNLKEQMGNEETNEISYRGF